MDVVLSINDRRKRVSGRGLCEPFTKKNVARRQPRPTGSAAGEAAAWYASPCSRQLGEDRRHMACKDNETL